MIYVDGGNPKAILARIWGIGLIKITRKAVARGVYEPKFSTALPSREPSGSPPNISAAPPQILWMRLKSTIKTYVGSPAGKQA